MLIHAACERRDSARYEVNHHVRKAMMIVLYSKDKEAMEEARKRIDAALRTWL